MAVWLGRFGLRVDESADAELTPLTALYNMNALEISVEAMK